MDEQRTEKVDQQFGGNDWGSLQEEPCRYCHQRGGVEFLASNGPLDRTGPQVVRCRLCGRVWDADGPLA